MKFERCLWHFYDKRSKRRFLWRSWIAKLKMFSFLILPLELSSSKNCYFISLKCAQALGISNETPVLSEGLTTTFSICPIVELSTGNQKSVDNSVFTVLVEKSTFFD